MLNILTAQGSQSAPTKLLSADADNNSAEVGLFALFGNAKPEILSVDKKLDDNSLVASAFFQLLVGAEKNSDNRNLSDIAANQKLADNFSAAFAAKSLLSGSDDDAQLDMLPKPKLEEKWLRGDDASLVVAAVLPNVQVVDNSTPVGVFVGAPLSKSEGNVPAPLVDGADKDLPMQNLPLAVDDSPVSPVVDESRFSNVLADIHPEQNAGSLVFAKQVQVAAVDVKNDAGKIMPILPIKSELPIKSDEAEFKNIGLDAKGDESLAAMSFAKEKNANLPSAFESADATKLENATKSENSSDGADIADVSTDFSALISSDGRDALLGSREKNNSHSANNIHSPLHENPQPTTPLPEQISVHIRQAIKDGKDNISVRMDPAELGIVEIKLEVRRDGKTQIMVSADNRDTLTALQSDSKGLERVINNAGIKTDGSSLQFNLRGENGDAAGNSQQQAGERQGEQNRQPYVPIIDEKNSKIDEVVERNYAFVVNNGLDIRV